MIREIILCTIMIIAFASIILGFIVWFKQKDTLILFDKSVKEKELKRYTKYTGIKYIIIGICVLPLTVFSIISSIYIEYFVKGFWVLGFLIICFINSKIKKL